MCVSSVGKEDSILSIDEGGVIVQSDLPVCMVLAVVVFFTISPVFEGVSIHIMLLGSWDEDMEHEGMRMCVDQWPEWGTGLTCDGCTKCSGELLDKGWPKDA